MNFCDNQFKGLGLFHILNFIIIKWQTWKGAPREVLKDILKIVNSDENLINMKKLNQSILENILRIIANFNTLELKDLNLIILI